MAKKNKIRKNQKSRREEQSKLSQLLISSEQQTKGYAREIKFFKGAFGITRASGSSFTSQDPNSLLISSVRNLIQKKQAIQLQKYDGRPGEYMEIISSLTKEKELSFAIDHTKKLCQSLSTSHHNDKARTKFKNGKLIAYYRAALIILNFKLYFLNQNDKIFITRSLQEVENFLTMEYSFSMLTDKHQKIITIYFNHIFAYAYDEQENKTMSKDHGIITRRAMMALYAHQKNMSYLKNNVPASLKYDDDILRSIICFAQCYLLFPLNVLFSPENKYQQEKVYAMLNIKECCILFKDLFTGMLEQKQIIIPRDNKTFNAPDELTFLYLAIENLIIILISFYKDHHLDMNNIKTMLPNLACEQLLSDIKALRQFLRYLLQSQQINTHVFLREITKSQVPNISQETIKKVFEQVANERLNDLENEILSAIQVQIIHQSKREELIKSLKDAEGIKSESQQTASEDAEEIKSERVITDQEIPDISEDFPEEKTLEDQVITTDYQEANILFQCGAFKAALEKLKIIETKTPAEKLEKLSFSLRCLFKLFDKQRRTIGRAIIAMEGNEHYVKAHWNELASNKHIQRYQQKMDITVIELFKLMKEHGIAFEPATTINKQIYDLLTQCQTDIHIHIPNNADDQTFDIMEDTEETSVFKTWSAFWPEAMVKAMLDSNADEDLRKIYSDQLEKAQSQFLQDFLLLKDFSQKTKQFLGKRQAIIKKLKDANRITSFNEGQQPNVDVLKWLKNKQDITSKHLNQVSKTIPKNGELIVSDEKQESRLTSPQLDSSSNASSPKSDFPPAEHQQPDNIAPVFVGDIALPISNYSLSPATSSSAKAEDLDQLSGSSAFAEDDGVSIIGQRYISLHPSAPTFFAPTQHQPIPSPDYVAIKNKIDEIIGLIFPDKNSQDNEASGNYQQVKGIFQRAFNKGAQNDAIFVPLQFHQESLVLYARLYDAHQNYSNLAYCAKILKEVLTQVREFLPQQASEVSHNFAS